MASWDGSSVDVWLSMGVSEGCDGVCIGVWERCAGIGVGNFERNNEFRQIIWVTLLLVHQWLFVLALFLVLIEWSIGIWLAG